MDEDSFLMCMEIVFSCVWRLFSHVDKDCSLMCTWLPEPVGAGVFGWSRSLSRNLSGAGAGNFQKWPAPATLHVNGDSLFMCVKIVPTCL